MHITRDMIDKDLRFGARIGPLLLKPTENRFRWLRFLQNVSVGQKVKGLSCDQVQIPRSKAEGTIRTRIYKPEQATGPLPVLVYFHGGGYAIGVPESTGGLFKQIIDTRPCVIVAPDYRKSLDEPYPAALDDCYDALTWAVQNAESLGVRTDQVMISGHSAGGGLTAAVALRARDQKDVALSFQMPIYPMIDDRMTSTSATNTNDPIWSSKHNALGWQLYLGNLFGSDDVPATAAPARATDLSGLPPTATYVGDLEPFRDETIKYVEDLKAAGVSVDFELFNGCYHGFDLFAPTADVSKRATAFILDAYARAVDTHFATQPSVATAA